MWKHCLTIAYPVLCTPNDNLWTCVICRVVRNIHVTSEILMIIAFSFDYITYSGAVVNAMQWLPRLLYLSAYVCGCCWRRWGNGEWGARQKHHNSAKVRFNVRNYYAYLLLFCVLNSFVCQHKSNMQAAVRGYARVCVCCVCGCGCGCSAGNHIRLPHSRMWNFGNFS